MLFNATFNNISVLSWHSVLLMRKLKKTTDLPQVTDKLSHNVVSSTPHHDWHSNAQLLVVIGTDCTGSCKSNYHTITMAPLKVESCKLQPLSKALKSLTV